MPKIEYHLKLEWDKIENAAHHYSRDYTITIKDKVEFRGSADKAFFGNSKLINPEDQLLSAISSCHMLSFLYLCHKKSLAVISYKDHPKGVLEFRLDGSGEFQQIDLFPQVKLSDQVTNEEFLALHKKAKSLCFIARSCNFPILHHPKII